MDTRNLLVPQQVKDPALSRQQLWLLLWLELDTWPGNFHMLRSQPKKKKKKMLMTSALCCTFNVYLILYSMYFCIRQDNEEDMITAMKIIRHSLCLCSAKQNCQDSSSSCGSSPFVAGSWVIGWFPAAWIFAP